LTRREAWPAATSSVLLVLIAIINRDAQEGMAGVLASLISPVPIVAAMLLTAAATAVYAWYGAKRLAVVFGVVAVVSVVAGGMWLYRFG
jgi:hypothetical protein